MKYIAHLTKDGSEQLLKDHLEGTACLAEKFAGSFGYPKIGYLSGKLHDIGKYSSEFQERIRGKKIFVDHSTAGAQAASGLPDPWNTILPYVIAGHHSGLPDSGTGADNGGSTLKGRLKKIVPDYSAYANDINLSVETDAFNKKELITEKDPWLFICFITRFLYSALVDADYLDTERFMNGEVCRPTGSSLNSLKADLDAYIKQKGWLNQPSANTINAYRSQILKAAIDKGLNAEKGLFSMTVPTGGGKTVSSLAFALNHAVCQKMDRVIYVIPYTSIIEQNAAVFTGILGNENVLEHHSNADFGSKEDFNPKKLASENWDLPVIVTTDAQFFESLYGNRSSKCRKLHNIANSVVIFDEIQALPDSCLIPCAKAIEILVKHCNCSAVYCTATQPELSVLTERGSTVEEIVPQSKNLYDVFRRVRYEYRSDLLFDDLISELKDLPQGLVILNSKEDARYLFEHLASEGVYCLTANLTPFDRKKMISEIRKKLSSDSERCLVIATNLIEAGVDLDFPRVYRELSKLDSMVQSGGRCNREGKRPVQDSVVTIFEFSSMEPDHKPIKDSAFTRRTQLTRTAMVQDGDPENPETIKRYFELLRKRTDKRFLDKNEIEKLFSASGMNFEKCAKDFALIDTNAATVYIPQTEIASSLIQSAKSEAAPDRSILRSLNPYSVQIAAKDAPTLLASGVLESLFADSNLYVLKKMEYYSPEMGLLISEK